MLFTDNACLFLGGATGTEIQRRGFSTTLPLWSAGALFKRPDLVREIYRDYIKAGADIIVTNTFRTQRRTLQKVGLEDETERINALATDVAVRAREDANEARHIFIAGSITTLEDCYRPDLVPEARLCQAEHSEQIELLAQTPIDFLLLETFNSVDEARIASEIAARTGMPYMVSFVVRDDGSIFNGDTWQIAVSKLAPLKPFAIGVNCVCPSVATLALEIAAPLILARGLRLSVYANGIGASGSEEGWDFSSQGSPVATYVEYCKKWKAFGASVIGGCCGTSPEYTEAYTKI